MKCLYQVARNFQSLFLSLAVTWMFCSLYTGTVRTLFVEWRKFVEMSGMVFLFLRCVQLTVRYCSMSIWAI